MLDDSFNPISIGPGNNDQDGFNPFTGGGGGGGIEFEFDEQDGFMNLCLNEKHLTNIKIFKRRKNGF